METKEEEAGRGGKGEGEGQVPAPATGWVATAERQRAIICLTDLSVPMNSLIFSQLRGNQNGDGRRGRRNVPIASASRELSHGLGEQGNLLGRPVDLLLLLLLLTFGLLLLLPLLRLLGLDHLLGTGLEGGVHGRVVALGNLGGNKAEREEKGGEIDLVEGLDEGLELGLVELGDDELDEVLGDVVGLAGLAIV